MTPQELHVKATVTVAEVDGLPTIVSSVLDVGGRVDGLDAARFEAVVVEAAALCPVSRLSAGRRSLSAAISSTDE